MNVKWSRLVVFSFASRQEPPSCIKAKADEAPSVIFSGEKVTCWQLCGIEPFLDKLTQVGFQLVDAYYKRRFSNNGKPYFVVSFIFSKDEFAQVSDYFLQIRDQVQNFLRDLVQAFCGSITFWNNPFFRGKEVIEDQRVYMFSCNGLGVDPRTTVRTVVCVSEEGEISS